MNKQANKLIHSGSPYLLQHAYNPVNWVPFDDAIFGSENQKLIIISIGYSACHWCHVMEHESFEDEQVAALMNQFFVNIKVDKEEHPQVDKVYMQACRVMTGGGGWPLNVICTPDGVPIHAGTYFTKEKWIHLLKTVQELYTTKPKQVAEFKTHLLDVLKQQQNAESSYTFTVYDLQSAIEKNSQLLDFDQGGLLGAPKFPMPILLTNMLNWSVVFGQAPLQQFTNLTLLKMVQGGLWDWVHGGFARYSVDDQWFVPHFEKMTYDNAQLLPLYAHASLRMRLPILQQVSNSLLQFIEHNLKLPSGLYASALDADTQEGEGVFYCYTIDECYQHLSPEQQEYCNQFMQFSALGNWENGLNIVRFFQAPAQRMQAMKFTAQELEEFDQKLFSKFAHIRSLKTPPALDYKAVCSFNGMLLTGLASAAQVMPQALPLAQQLQQAMQQFHQPQGLWHQISKGNPQHTPLLCDYSFYIQGLMQLGFATQQISYFNQAVQVLQWAIEHHYLNQNWTYQPAHQPLFTLANDAEDDVIPSAYSTLALSLLHLSNIFAHVHWHSMAVQLVQLHHSAILKHPLWHSNWASVWLQNYAQNPVVICSNSDAYAQFTQQWTQQLPLTVPVLNAQQLQAPITQDKYSPKTAFYICLQTTCLAPVHQPEQVVEIILDYFNPDYAIGFVTN